MEAMIGRFISPDPVGAVDSTTGKINQKVLVNPQRLNRYAYSLNNPYKYIDEDGRWAEEVHNQIIQKAFGDIGQLKYYLLPHLRFALELGSAHVDKEYQDPKYSYMHGMKAPGQTVQEARSLMNKFIEDKVKEYKELKEQGKLYEAYKKLGEAMHPIMDSTSPLHEGFQIWPGFNAPKHLWGETKEVFESNPSYERKSVDSVRKFYDRYVRD